MPWNSRKLLTKAAGEIRSRLIWPNYSAKILERIQVGESQSGQASQGKPARANQPRQSGQYGLIDEIERKSDNGAASRQMSSPLDDRGSRRRGFHRAIDHQPNCLADNEARRNIGLAIGKQGAGNVATRMMRVICLAYFVGHAYFSYRVHFTGKRSFLSVNGIASFGQAFVIIVEMRVARTFDLTGVRVMNATPQERMPAQGDDRGEADERTHKTPCEADSRCYGQVGQLFFNYLKSAAKCLRWRRRKEASRASALDARKKRLILRTANVLPVFPPDS